MYNPEEGDELTDYIEMPLPIDLGVDNEESFYNQLKDVVKTLLIKYKLIN